MEWQSEFQYLLHNKILSRDGFQELLDQIASVIYRETFPLKKQIEEYQTATGWAKVIELEQQIARINNSFLKLSKMKDIMREYINNDDEWQCDELVERIYNAQEENRL